MNAEAEVKGPEVLELLPRIPIFALQAWLYPGVPLSLQVFEPRYLDMVTRQLKKGEGFGVASIRQGREVGGIPQIHSLGVMVSLTDWRQQPNGLLGITVLGEERFRIAHTKVQDDGLLVSAIEQLPENLGVELNESVNGLVAILEQLKQHDTIKAMNLPAVTDTAMLSWQLAHVLPINSTEKMALFTLAEPEERLEYLSRKISLLSAE